jgi:hypothetical protein
MKVFKFQLYLLIIIILMITVVRVHSHESEGMTRGEKTPSALVSANANEITDAVPDIEKILEEAAQADDHIITETDRGIESHREKIIVLTEIAKIQKESGNQNGAEVTIQHAIQSATGVIRSQVIYDLRLIASTQVEIGDSAGAQTTIQHMLQLPNPKIYGEIAEIAATQADLGDFTGAFRTISMIKDKVERADGLSQIASIQANTGNINAAFHTAETVKDMPIAKAVALLAIARAQAKDHDQVAVQATIQEALQTALLIKPNEIRYYRTLPAIAQTQAEIGDIKGALKTAKMIKVEFQEDAFIDAIKKIARAQACAGDIKGALETVKAINNGVEKVNALLEIAETQAEGGDIKGAFQTIKEIKVGRFFILEKIAIAQAKAGDLTGALLTADAINVKDSVGRAHAFHAIAAARVKVGEAKKALAWASNLSTPIEKAYALLGVAEGLLSQKQAASTSNNRE